MIYLLKKILQSAHEFSFKFLLGLFWKHPRNISAITREKRASRKAFMEYFDCGYISYASYCCKLALKGLLLEQNADMKSVYARIKRFQWPFRKAALLAVIALSLVFYNATKWSWTNQTVKLSVELRTNLLYLNWSQINEILWV